MDKKTTNVYETTNYRKFKKWLDAKIHKQKIEQHKKERMAV